MALPILPLSNTLLKLPPLGQAGPGPAALQRQLDEYSASGLISAPLNLLAKLGYALDTPGAYLRGLLAGKPGERVSGREMLEEWGLLSANQPGLDVGDVAGLAAEIVLDPLNLLSAGQGAQTGTARTGRQGGHQAGGTGYYGFASTETC